jgi:hypothetical protein
MMSYANYEWFLEHDLSNYAGRWVAIIDKKVVASEKDVDKLLGDVKRIFPGKKPLVTKVRDKLSIL